MGNNFKFNTTISTVIIFAFVALLFLLLGGKSEPKEELKLVEDAETPRAETENFDWRGSIPLVRAALNKTFPAWGGNDEYATVERDNEISIESVADVTGDGVDEAIVYLGTGGATTSDVVVMSASIGEPVVVKFREPDGSVQATTFIAGGGGSGRYGGTVGFDPSRQAVIVTFMNVYGEPTDSCDAWVYVWNERAGIFEFNMDHSLNESKKLLVNCKAVAEETGVKFQGR